METAPREKAPTTRRRRISRLALAATLSVAIAGALAACNPAPGEGRIRLQGGVVGRASGPVAQCHGPGHYADEYGSWEWAGEVNGESVNLQVVDIGSYVIAFLKVESLEWYGASTASEGWSFTVLDGVARIHAVFEPWTPTPDAPLVEATLVLTCPGT